METSTREETISASTIAIQARRGTRVLQLPTRAVADPEGLRPFASTAAACSRSEPAGFASPPHDGFALVGEGTAGAKAPPMPRDEATGAAGAGLSLVGPKPLGGRGS